MASQSPIVFQSPITSAQQAFQLLNTLDQAMVLPGAKMPDLPGVGIMKDGQVTDVGTWGYSPVLIGYILRATVARVRELMPEATAQAVARKAADLVVKASETFNMASPLVLPGAVSADVTLTLNPEVNMIMLLGAVSPQRDADIFTMPKCSIGISKLVADDQVLSPASSIAGCTLAAFEGDGVPGGQIMPIFGITYRTENGQPINITATFAHGHQFGDLAYPAIARVSWLALCHRVPKNCMHPDAAALFAQAAATTCRV